MNGTMFGALLGLIAAATPAAASAQTYVARQKLSGMSQSATPAKPAVWFPDSVLYWNCPSRQGLILFQYVYACYEAQDTKVADSRCAGSGARPDPTPALPQGETCTLTKTQSLHP